MSARGLCGTVYAWLEHAPVAMVKYNPMWMVGSSSSVFSLEMPIVGHGGHM